MPQASASALALAPVTKPVTLSSHCQKVPYFRRSRHSQLILMNTIRPPIARAAHILRTIYYRTVLDMESSIRQCK